MQSPGGIENSSGIVKRAILRQRTKGQTYRPGSIRRALRGRQAYVQVAGTSRWVHVPQAFVFELSKAYSLICQDGEHSRTYVQAIPRRV